MANHHWTVSKTAWRPAKNAALTALIYDPTPGGKKNADGTASYSLRFPVVVFTDHLCNTDQVAAEVARKLEAFPDMLAALKAMLAKDKPGFRTNGQVFAAQELARAAIAKAEGGAI